MSLDFPRQRFGHFPTPIEYLENISNHFNGPQIYIKRDDCTGLATGGNKTRKLEYLMPDAIKNKASTIITVGAVQSNHARQTAAACALLNLKCLIVLEERLENAPMVYKNSGNVFLDKLFGAEIVVCPKNRDVKEYAEELMVKFKSNGEIPYFIPVGGSNVTSYLLGLDTPSLLRPKPSISFKEPYATASTNPPKLNLGIISFSYCRYKLLMQRLS